MRIIPKYLLAVLLIVQANTKGLGQNYLYNFKNFSEDDGLNTEYCYSICEDKLGFIWVGTGDGLYRYDGHSFKAYKSPLDKDEKSVSTLLVSINYDPYFNRIWLMSLYDLQYFDLNTYTFHPWLGNEVNDLKPQNEFRSQIQISDNELLVSSGAHIFNYNITKKTFNKINNQIKFPIDCNKKFLRLIAFDDAHIIMLSSNYLFVVDKQTYNIVYQTKSNGSQYFQNAFHDKSRYKLYIAALNGLVVYNYRKDTSAFFSESYQTLRGKKLPFFINFFAPFGNDFLLTIGSELDIVFDRNSEQLHVIKHLAGTKNDRSSPNNMFTDSRGNIWTSTYDKYCSVMYKENIGLVSSNFILNNHGINVEPYKTYRLTNDTFGFCGSGITGIGLINPKTGNWELLENKQNALPYVYDIVKLPDGRVWTCDDFTINEVNLINKKIKPISFDLNGKNLKLSKIYYLRMLNNDILVASGKGSIYYINIHSLKAQQYDIEINHPKILSQSNREFVILNASTNKMYFNTDIGMFVLNEKLEMNPFVIPPASNNKRSFTKANAMEIDQFGNLWFGSIIDGLFKYDVKSKLVVNFNIENSNLKNNLVSYLKCDRNGKMWVASGKRLYLFDVEKDQLNSVISNDFGIIGGGYGIYGGGVDSIMAFNYYPYILFKNIARETLNTKSVKKVKLISFKINDQEQINAPWLKDTMLTLKHNQNNLCFAFTNLSLVNGNLNQYRYKLMGLDTAWHYTTLNNVCFERLPYGTYDLLLEDSDNTGALQNERLTLHFKIEPIYYRSWWFISVSLIFLSCLLYFFSRNKIRKIREEEKLKSDFKKQVSELEMKALRAQMNPHFIFNSLNSIQKFIFDKDEYAASQYLTKFSRLIRLILDQSDQDFTTLGTEMDLIKLYIEMESLRFTNSFEHTISLDKSINLETKIPSMIIQPHIENAIWHGLLHLPKDTSSWDYRQGKLDIEIKKTNVNQIEITITDNGVGREKAKEYRSKQILKKKSYGSNISEERIRIFNEMHGVNTKFEVRDNYDSLNNPVGTEIKIILAYDSPTS